ncbi:MAG: hypothetical protein V3V16_08540 [Melioribacteraceae bacterium]
MSKLVIIIFISLTISLNLFGQEFIELPPPDSLFGSYADSSVQLAWQSPTNWDSLKFNIFKATIFDTSNIDADALNFQMIETTKDTMLVEKYSTIKNLSHISFMYYVVTKDTNDVESVRSNYCLINIK